MSSSLPLDHEPIVPPAVQPLTGIPAHRARPGERLRGLDALRGVAALGVLVYHYTSNYQRVLGHRGPLPFGFHLGALGVQLFFVISGFVIFMTLDKTRRPIDFVRSRFSRLFPAYWTAIALTFTVLTLFPLPGRHVSLARALVDLTMCQELLGVGHIDPVYWTLQLELCFYGIMLILFATRQLRRAEYFLLGLVALSAVEAVTMPRLGSFFRHHHRLNVVVGRLDLLLVLGHIHAFLIGIMLFKLRTRFAARDAAVLLICLAYSFAMEPRVDFYATLLFTVLVYAAARGWTWPLENPVLLFLGLISYSLYLTHQNIGYVIIRAAEARGAPPMVAIAITAAVALLIATAITYGIERPALRLLRARDGRKPTPIDPRPQQSTPLVERQETAVSATSDL